MALKKIKNLDIKKITRGTSVAVTVLSLLILGLTAWFLMSALNQDTDQSVALQDLGPSIETLNLKLLEQIRTELDKKTAPPPGLPPRLRNPYVIYSPPVTAPPPTPPPEPTPPPTTEPPAQQ